jgi:hypothetical protein
VSGRVLLKSTGAPPEDFAVSFAIPLPTKSERPVQTMEPGFSLVPSEGRFWSMDAIGGDQTIVILVEGHATATRSFTVGDDDVDLGDILIE